MSPREPPRGAQSGLPHGGGAAPGGTHRGPGLAERPLSALDPEHTQPLSWVNPHRLSLPRARGGKLPFRGPPGPPDSTSDERGPWTCVCIFQSLKHEPGGQPAGRRLPDLIRLWANPANTWAAAGGPGTKCSGVRGTAPSHEIKVTRGHQGAGTCPPLCPASPVGKADSPPTGSSCFRHARGGPALLPTPHPAPRTRTRGPDSGFPARAPPDPSALTGWASTRRFPHVPG